MKNVVLYENRDGNKLNVGVKEVEHPAFKGYAFKYEITYGQEFFLFGIGEEGKSELASVYPVGHKYEDLVNLVSRITGSTNREECVEIALYFHEYGWRLKNRFTDDIDGRVPRDRISDNMYM